MVEALPFFQQHDRVAQKASGVLALLSDEGLTLDMSAFKLFTVANLRYHSVNNTKLPCYTFLPTQHHSFFRNYPLYSFTNSSLADEKYNCF